MQETPPNHGSSWVRINMCTSTYFIAACASRFCDFHPEIRRTSSFLLEQALLYYHYILFAVFLGMLMSHSRTEFYDTHRFFCRKGWRREKRKHLFLLLFSLQRGNPGAIARSDSESEWKQDLRPRWENPDSLSLFIPVTCALVNCTWGAQRKFTIVCGDWFVLRK